MSERLAAGPQRPDGSPADAAPAEDPGRAELEAQRDFCLRSIRDLDAEHEAGDLDEADYRSLRDTYTARAATILRTLAGEIPADPVPAGAAAVAAVSEDGDRAPEPPGARAGRTRRTGRIRRMRPPRRRTLLVVVGLALAAAGAGWAVAASSGTRLPGQPVSGQPLGAEATQKYLDAAQAASDKGDYLTAIKDYQKILDNQPDQPEALTGEGWVLAQTQQPNLLRRGLTLLASAERASPGYAPAHVYRGIALLSEGDYAGAVPELKWYLAHQPDAQLEPQVRQALQQAEAKVAGEGPAPTTTATAPTG